jgi:glyoxylase-like metal-dependent hydrolase (beta-lactamase superfamily II)
MKTYSEEIIKDILILNFTVVTACLVGDPLNESDSWVLIDTGLENSYDYIVRSSEKRFGKNSRPSAIILTHGHFDHVGSVIKLSKHWDVPVFIHSSELPYVTGKKDYPIADSSAGGGLVAAISPSFPHTCIDLGYRAASLPEDGSLPGMPGWKYIYTPGHTDGHISLFRESDRVLIAGDAFATVKQESLFSVLTQRENISGPPSYFTTDWQSAEKSVRILRDLKPSLVIPSHGQPMMGEDLSRHLNLLVNNFYEIAVPEKSRFL